MAIFSRRILQRMLDANAKLDRPSAQKHAQRLNRCDEDTIATEWEVALLYGLSQIGLVQHEPDPDGAAVLDIYFSATDGGLKFIGDVVTVTDFGLEKQNPIREFQREVARRSRKLGLASLAGFNFEYGDWLEGECRDRKVFIAVPPSTRYAEFFDDEFTGWIRDICSEPHAGRAWRKQATGIDVTISYVPGEQHVGGHHAAFTIPQSLTRNPLFRALDRKASQLKRSGRAEPAVIIACDGGSASLTRRLGGTVHSYSAEQIIARFLADHSVEIVLLVRVERRMESNSFRFGPPFLRFDVFVNTDVNEDFVERVKTLAERLRRLIPSPENDPTNAINHLRWRDRRIGRSHAGGLTMNRDFIKLSARALQELLAGRVTSEAFLKEHAFVPVEGQSWSFNPFELALKEGRLIREIEVETSESDDDDWIVFHFSDRDAAISSFKVE